MRQRGFTLIEVIVALLILAIVITTSLAVFVERTRRLQQATETILAYQALSNEAEIRRRIPFQSLDTAPSVFLIDKTVIEPLQPYTTYVTVADVQTDVKNVTMFIRWHAGQRIAKLALIRVNTGGSNLW
jgi:prepilin-type N-terminal cleavage/methylation domain-containing protein